MKFDTLPIFLSEMNAGSDVIGLAGIRDARSQNQSHVFPTLQIIFFMKIKKIYIFFRNPNFETFLLFKNQSLFRFEHEINEP